ncbi:MAG: class I SAM-dependent methyltransferase [Candidatus Hermodarchaeota archaeon]
MAIKDPAIIKKIVRTNFDKSADLYEQFEQKYGLFKHLTIKLAQICKIRKGMRVCDVGTGTGTSSFVLQKIVGSEGLVYGVDFSEKMLEIAQTKLNRTKSANIKFILSDADELEANIKSKVDSVLYNAAIFIIPNPSKTFQSAYRILTENGIIGMNYLLGLYDGIASLENESENNDLFLLSKQAGKKFAPYGRQITNVKTLPEILKNVGFRNIKEGIISKKMSLDEMKSFYSIPAQSAALWPKNKYEERLTLLDSVVEYFQEININTYYQHWGWCIGQLIYD